MLSLINEKYRARCTRNSDINEHLPTLYEYAKKVDHITECGVRGVVSSYAFAAGLLGNPRNRLIQVDLETNGSVDDFHIEAAVEGINSVFYHQSDLNCPIEQTDLLFIDTWHIYGQLKRELARWHSHVTRYIIMHDTTIDEWHGESVRGGSNMETQSLETGIPVEEIGRGLWPAIEEFLAAHPEWILEHRYTNNNGLTILARKI
jgi:hypothetical protein